VLVPGYTDQPREIQEVATFGAGLGNGERVDVLPFHKLAPKYEHLGIPFPLAATPPELAAVVRERFGRRALG
jgi:pyruvate formate lyase activating enzyme